MHMIIVKEHEGLLMIVLLNYNRTRTSFRQAV